MLLVRGNIYQHLPSNIIGVMESYWNEEGQMRCRIVSRLGDSIVDKIELFVPYQMDSKTKEALIKVALKSWNKTRELVGLPKLNEREAFFIQN